ncbi:MAG: carbohydrate ABC transporter permease [Candidatus Sericytochromatia bacterium]
MSKRHPARGSEARWALVFLLPALVGLGLFNAVPTIHSFYLSFTRWNFLGTPRFVGLENYRDLFADSLFYQVLGQTLLYATATVVGEVVLALGLALLLARPLKGMAVFRTAFFLPVVTSLVAVAILWGWIYDPQLGVLNWALGKLGVAPIAWLSEPGWAMAAVVILSIWKGLGYNVILLLAGLSAIPTQYEEAAMVDGANGFQRLASVTLPLLAPTLFLVITVALINAFQAFDAIYMLTGGGPANATNVMVFWLYKQAFQYYHVGKASAIAYVLFAIVLAVTWAQWRVRKQWVHLES